MEFVKVQVITNEDFVDDVFQQTVTTNSIYDAETWNFKLIYNIDDSVNCNVLKYIACNSNEN